MRSPRFPASSIPRCEYWRSAWALGAFAGLPRVTLEDAVLIAKALDWTIQGMDFADALHLANAQGCDAFVTLDRRFARAAKELSDVKVRTL